MSKTRTIRIFHPTPLVEGETVALSKEAAHHVGVVLRMQIDDSLTLFCGDNREYEATLVAVRKKEVHAKVEAVTLVHRESPLRLHLAQALSKGEKMEFVVQKAVELGIASITPVITAHCAYRLDAEKLEKKEQQWRNIAIGACEQSGRTIIPTIAKTISLERYLQTCPWSTKLMLHPKASTPLCSLRPFTPDIALLIGPEGGLSEAEVELGLTHQFKSASLGPRILRTETATIAAISVIQALEGDL